VRWISQPSCRSGGRGPFLLSRPISNWPSANPALAHQALQRRPPQSNAAHRRVVVEHHPPRQPGSDHTRQSAPRVRGRQPSAAAGLQNGRFAPTTACRTRGNRDCRNRPPWSRWEIQHRQGLIAGSAAAPRPWQGRAMPGAASGASVCGNPSLPALVRPAAMVVPPIIGASGRRRTLDHAQRPLVRATVPILSSHTT